MGIFQTNLQFQELLFPVISLGVLLCGFLLFLNIYYYSRLPLFRSILYLAVISLIFMTCETLILVFGSLLHNYSIGRQFHRIEQVAAAFFLSALPYLLLNLFNTDEKWNKINKIIALAGLGLALCISIIAFIIPDYYISIREGQTFWLVRESAYGRGREGIVYIFRDVVLLVIILYFLIFSTVKMIRVPKNRYVRPIVASIAVAAMLAVDDIIFTYGQSYIGIFSQAQFS